MNRQVLENNAYVSKLSELTRLQSEVYKTQAQTALALGRTADFKWLFDLHRKAELTLNASIKPTEGHYETLGNVVLNTQMSSVDETVFKTINKLGHNSRRLHSAYEKAQDRTDMASSGRTGALRDETSGQALVDEEMERAMREWAV